MGDMGLSAIQVSMMALQQEMLRKIENFIYGAKLHKLLE